MRSLLRACAAAGALGLGCLPSLAAAQAAPVLKLSILQGIPAIYRASTLGADALLGATAVPFGPAASAQVITLKLVVTRPGITSAPRDRHFWVFDVRNLQQTRRAPLVVVIQAAPPTFCRETALDGLHRTATEFTEDIAAAQPGRAYTAVSESELLNLALKASALAYRCAEMTDGDAARNASRAAAIANGAYRLLLDNPEYGFRQSGPPPWRFEKN